MEWLKQYINQLDNYNNLFDVDNSSQSAQSN